MSEVVETEGQDITISDESIYQELLFRSGGKFRGDEEAVGRFEPIYRKLHTLAEQLGIAYSELCKTYGLNPGRVDVVLGGGRAKSKPFNEDSDLDIFFHVGNFPERLDLVPFSKYTGNPTLALDEKVIKMQALVDKTKSICAEHEVPNEFHIMGFGNTIPERYRKEDQLLLATINGSSHPIQESVSTEG